ncbi:MAG TPA: alpha/beta fold hydrolase, partial [Burkholderiaceae bacterium]|nr:alpha/beta fold hydrolase [Burkholderiaceae bacterium]
MIRIPVARHYHWPVLPAVFTSSLYPPPRAFRTRWLPVTGGHELWVQESGCESGIPALVLHGGPGSGCSPLLARFFDPARYRVLCVDQRGAGRSRPAGGIEHNTLADLLGDLRLLRIGLGVDQWLVVGGSWGATLALLHAVDDPGAVSALLLRSVFLARREDVNGFFGMDTEAGRRQWDELCRTAGHEGVVDALAAIFAHGPLHAQREAARSWWHWEQVRSGLAPQEPADAAF